MNDQSELLLSDLCKICTTNPPKYCCPRCSSLTCSLPCYKRHKAWSSCNGVRDPAAYIKINQLATPAGIDRDYNFLTGIERSFDKAELGVERRGISLEGGSRAGGAGAPVSGSNLQRALEKCGVDVKRMPKGMTRQKTNRTMWHTKHKCIAWTVEWIHPDGTRDTAQCRENISLEEAYGQLLVEKQSTKKRKRSENATVSTSAGAQSVARAAVASSDMAHTITDQSTQPPQPANFTTPGLPATSDTTTTAHSHPASQTPASNSNFPEPSRGNTTSPTYHIYLHKPHTPTKHPVLISLPSTSTLSVALRHRTIIEYPTLYVLHEPPNLLPRGFELEEQVPPKITVVDIPDSADIAAQGEKLSGSGNGFAIDQVGFDTEANAGTGAEAQAQAGAAVEFEVDNVLELLQRDIESLSKVVTA